MSNSLERANKALKENQNLDLDNYKTHIKEFSKFSEEIFDPHENIFVDRKKEMISCKDCK